MLWYSVLIAIAFWWLPLSFRNESHEHDKIHGDRNKQIISDLLAHLGDHYQMHFGEVCLSLPIILYKPGGGWYYFSSKHFFKGHGKGCSYTIRGSTFVLEDAGVKAADGSRVYDFSITKNMVWIIISMLLMLLLFIGLVFHLRGRQGHPPKGFWVLPFYMVRFVRNEIARKNIGVKHYERFTPYLLTIFFYILFNNLLGLLPEGANITGNLSVALTLGFFTFMITNWHGSKSYWGHIFTPPGVPKVMYPIMVPIELLGIVLRPFILSLRLFGNMVAGHTMLVLILGLTFLLHIFASIFIVPLATGIILLKILVSFIQAYVFTLLSAMAIGTAVEEH
ncbi:MAG: F0F1 ATP synthase subunit A [Cytophagales bacterium]